jgi:NADH dehydrogenase FAD-containing subunit
VRVQYDTLVIAIGSQTNDFGTPGVRENSIMLDSPAAAQRFHQRLINCCLRKARPVATSFDAPPAKSPQAINPDDQDGR